MELKFSNDIEFELGEGCEFELPSYVVCLSEEELLEAHLSEDKSVRIIAAGTDPHDEKMTLLTAAGKVMVFDAKSFYIPTGPSRPSHCGTKVFLENLDNRWPGSSPGYFVESNWLLQHSSSGLIGATIKTNNYVHEDKTK